MGKNWKRSSKNIEKLALYEEAQLGKYFQKTEKCLYKTIRQLLLISYLYHTMLKK